MFYGDGLIIDKDKKRYKKYISFLFFKIGEWESLPDFSFVAITTVMGSQTLNNPQTFVASSTFKVRMYGVYLCIDKNRKVQVMKTKNQQEAVKLAKGVSEYLSIEYINYIK